MTSVQRCATCHEVDETDFVFCDGCDNGYHKQCHKPEPVVPENADPWFCRNCEKKPMSALGRLQALAFMVKIMSYSNNVICLIPPVSLWTSVFGIQEEELKVWIYLRLPWCALTHDTE